MAKKAKQELKKTDGKMFTLEAMIILNHNNTFSLDVDLFKEGMIFKEPW